MGKYVDSSVAQGEDVRYTARVSLWKFSLYLLVGGVLLVCSCPLLVMALIKSSTGSNPPPPGAVYLYGFLLLLAIVLLIWPFIIRRSTELVITDKRLISKYGVISTHSIEIRFSKIETVRVTQGLLGKILSYGDIMVTGTGSTFDPFRDIANPMAFRAALNQAMELHGSDGSTLSEHNSAPVKT